MRVYEITNNYWRVNRVGSAVAITAILLRILYKFGLDLDLDLDFGGVG